jgi:tRNA G26 N,N-dimethylase Trm1
MFKWDKNKEQEAAKMRESGVTYTCIGSHLGTTSTSVKHKIRRIQQGNNLDRYKHTAEKIAQIQECIPSEYLKTVLETHAGFGGLTDFYSDIADEVLALEIDQKRVASIKDLHREVVAVVKCDSERELFSLVYNRCKFTLVDVDPYGLPSRYFPHVFALIDDGYLVLTFPVLGVAQINKITIAHYKNFWDFELSDKESYMQRIIAGLSRYAFMHKRTVEIVSLIKIERIYRFVIRVKKESMLDIVGLTVNRQRHDAGE